MHTEDSLSADGQGGARYDERAPVLKDGSLSTDNQAAAYCSCDMSVLAVEPSAALKPSLSSADCSEPL